MGKHLVRELVRCGHAVTIATRGKATDDFSDSVDRIIINRLDENSLKKVFSHRRFDVVFDSLVYCSNDVKRLLDHISCPKYVMTSSTAVYDKHLDTKEGDFDPLSKELIWCDRDDFAYGEAKRQAECALFQKYANVPSVAARFPFVIGRDDYTRRLYFYVDHIVNQKPMHVDNYDKQMSFVRSDEAGRFLALFAQADYLGTVNGASGGTISVKDIAKHIETKTGKRPILSPEGDRAPYNGENEYSINTDRAIKLGFHFSPLHTWIYDLIDYYINEATV